MTYPTVRVFAPLIGALTWLLSVPLAAQTPTAPASGPASAGAALFEELTGRRQSAPRDASAWQRDYQRAIADLCATIANGDTEQRGVAVDTLERIAFRAARPGAEIERHAFCLAAWAQFPQVTHAARVGLLRKLILVGGDESVSPLAALLSDSNAEISDLARRALEMNPAADVTGALRTALASADETRLVAILGTISASRADDLLDDVLRLLDHPSDRVALAAADAAARMPRAEAFGALRARLATADAGRASGFLHAAVLASPVASHGGENLTSFLAETAQSSADPVTRAAALRELLHDESDFGADILCSWLTGSDDRLRALAGALCQTLPQSRQTARLAAAAARSPAPAQVMIVLALAAQNAPETRDLALQFLASGDESVRLAALEALRTAGSSADLAAIVKIAAQGGAAERKAARQTLERLPGTGVDDALRAGLAQAAPDSQIEMLRALTARRCRTALAEIRALTRGGDNGVQTEAFAAVGALGAAADVPSLLERLPQITEETVRSAAMSAIVGICQRESDEAARVAPILAALRATGAAQRAPLLTVLGRLGGPAALEPLRAALADSDAAVVDAAVRAVCEWNGAEVANDLVRIADKPPAAEHRVLALRGLVRVLKLPNERYPSGTAIFYRRAADSFMEAGEQKLLLSGLSDVPHAEALELAQAVLNTHRDEAIEAILAIARGLAAEHAPTARAALDALAGPQPSEDLKKKIADARTEVDRFDGYCVSWKVAGPYRQQGADRAAVFDVAFAPEQAQPATPVQWTKLPPTSGRAPWSFDLASRFKQNNCVMYATCQVWSGEASEARLVFGSDDGVKVFLNGEQVFGINLVRSLDVGEDKVDVKLRKGWNTLLLKVTQGAGGWGFAAGVRGRDDKPLRDVRFRAGPEDAP